jgi:hypothetical protein
MARKTTPGKIPPEKLNEQQIAQAVGSFTPISQKKALTASVDTATEAQAARQVRQLVIDMLLIGVKYNNIAKAHGDDARKFADSADLERDRATLKSIFGEDYTLTDPFGGVHDQAANINAILAGTIQQESIGKGGFETLEDTIKIYGDTAVSVGTIRMKGVIKAKSKTTGALRRKDITGVYRTTHTFVKRDGQWVFTTSHMTQVPKERRAPS